jgi:hypothetical protein
VGPGPSRTTSSRKPPHPPPAQVLTLGCTQTPPNPRSLRLRFEYLMCIPNQDPNRDLRTATASPPGTHEALWCSLGVRAVQGWNCSPTLPWWASCLILSLWNLSFLTIKVKITTTGCYGEQMSKDAHLPLLLVC